MSTKTTIKRVALVAAVALTLGGFSAVSASATSTTSITQNDGTGDGGVGGVAGPANSLQVTVLIGSEVSAHKGYVTVTGGTITSAVSGAAIAANGLSAVIGATDSLTISTPTAGSLVINEYDATSNSTFSSTVSVTKTITINATAVSGTYNAAKSSVFIATGETNTAVTADATVVALGSKPNANDSATATIQVIYRDANGSNITNDSITATITGPGVINGLGDSDTIATHDEGKASFAANNYSKSVTSDRGAATFVVFPNGQTGVATVTVKNSAGTVLGTKTLTFTGSTPASIKVKVLKAYVTTAAGSTTDAIAYNVYDASGNEIKSLTTAPTAAVATGVTANGEVTCHTSYNDTKGYFTCDVAPKAATSASTKDFVDAYTFTAVTGVTTTASVNYVQPVAATLTIAGPDSAAPGDKITYTLTAKNANGNPIPDAAYAPGTFIGSVGYSANLVSVPFGAGDTVTTVNGVATATTYAPYGSTLTVTWTLAGSTAGVASGLLAKTLTATDVAASTTISGSQDSALAVDAANAATDAANAAAEEASNATEAASEALAAVNALATTVASLIAGIKSQLTALTSLVKKLQK